MGRHFFKTILAKLQSGIIVIDLDCRIKMVNNYVAECCGLPVEQFVGKSLKDISLELYEKILESKTSAEIHSNIFGKEKVIGFNLSVLTARHGGATGYIINLKDLTEIDAIRKDLRKKEHLAAIGEVVGRFAHEMRNPLFGITASAQILEMELPLTGSHQELMDSLLRESDRLNNLVTVLHECTSGIRLTKKRIDLSRVLDDAVQEVAAMINEQKLTLQQNYDRELWLSADAGNLQRALINLLKNAVENSPVGAAIELTAVAVDDGLLVMVTDQGSGIAPENLAKIFDLFYTTRKNRSGLGLPSSNAIVVAHGGRLTAEPGPNGGARFVLQLPLGECSR